MAMVERFIGCPGWGADLIKVTVPPPVAETVVSLIARFYSEALRWIVLFRLHNRHERT